MVARLSAREVADFDVIVIGGGSGGIAFASAAAKHGARVALIERDALGGTCVNRGCVPKKLLWQAASWRRQGLDMAEVGVTTTPEVSFGVLRQRIDDKIKGIRKSHEQTLSDCGVTVFRGGASVGMDLAVNLDDKRLTAGRLILATGARPATLDIPGADRTETSDEFFAWKTLPQSVAVLGGGYIGCELSSILSALGVKITLIDPSERLLSPFDGNLASFAEQNLRRAGVDVVLRTEPTDVKERLEGLEVIANGRSVVAAERVLNATGRVPNLEAIGPLAERLESAESGALAVDASLTTNVDKVHAVGDLADRLPLTSVATRDGSDLADILFGEGGALIELTRVARAAFVIPPVAEVGIIHGGEGGARLADGVVGPEGTETTWRGVGTNSEADLTGFALAGDHAAELIAFAATLLRRNADLLETAEGVHPSFSEELIGR